MRRAPPWGRDRPLEKGFTKGTKRESQASAADGRNQTIQVPHYLAVFLCELCASARNSCLWPAIRNVIRPGAEKLSPGVSLRRGGGRRQKTPGIGLTGVCKPPNRTLAARGRSPVGRVASAAGARTRRSDASDAGHRLGDATKSAPGAAATLWPARIWPDSFVARRGRWPASISSSRLALEPNRGCAAPRDFCHGLLEIQPQPEIDAAIVGR
jgi:hypothetical protein